MLQFYYCSIVKIFILFSFDNIFQAINRMDTDLESKCLRCNPHGIPLYKIDFLTHNKYIPFCKDTKNNNTKKPGIFICA